MLQVRRPGTKKEVELSEEVDDLLETLSSTRQSLQEVTEEKGVMAWRIRELEAQVRSLQEFVCAHGSEGASGPELRAMIVEQTKTEMKATLAQMRKQWEEDTRISVEQAKRDARADALRTYRASMSRLENSAPIPISLFPEDELQKRTQLTTRPLKFQVVAALLWQGMERCYMRRAWGAWAQWKGHVLDGRAREHAHQLRSGTLAARMWDIYQQCEARTLVHRWAHWRDATRMQILAEHREHQHTQQGVIDLLSHGVIAAALVRVLEKTQRRRVSRSFVCWKHLLQTSHDAERDAEAQHFQRMLAAHRARVFAAQLDGVTFRAQVRRWSQYFAHWRSVAFAKKAAYEKNLARTTVAQQVRANEHQIEGLHAQHQTELSCLYKVFASLRMADKLRRTHREKMVRRFAVWRLNTLHGRQWEGVIQELEYLHGELTTSRAEGWKVKRQMLTMYTPSVQQQQQPQQQQQQHPQQSLRTPVAMQAPLLHEGQHPQLHQVQQTQAPEQQHHSDPHHPQQHHVTLAHLAMDNRNGNSKPEQLFQQGRAEDTYERRQGEELEAYEHRPVVPGDPPRRSYNHQPQQPQPRAASSSRLSRSRQGDDDTLSDGQVSFLEVHEEPIATLPSFVGFADVRPEGSIYQASPRSAATPHSSASPMRYRPRAQQQQQLQQQQQQQPPSQYQQYQHQQPEIEHDSAHEWEGNRYDGGSWMNGGRPEPGNGHDRPVRRGRRSPAPTLDTQARGPGYRGSTRQPAGRRSQSSRGSADDDSTARTGLGLLEAEGLPERLPRDWNRLMPT